MQDGDVGAFVDVGLVAVGPEDDEVAALPGPAQIFAEQKGDTFVVVLVHDECSGLEGGLLLEFKDQFLSGHLCLSRFFALGSQSCSGSVSGFAGLGLPGNSMPDQVSGF